MGRIKRIIIELIKGTITAFVWLLFALIVRPAVLIVEMVFALIEFGFDIVTFPVQIMRSMEEGEKKDG